MNFANVKHLTIPEGSVYQIISGSTVLWSKSYTPPSSSSDGRLLYLQNGDDWINRGIQNWSIDTGITWRNVFLNSSSLGLEYPGLETEITYAYSYVPPEGGVFAGCNPRYNQEGGGGSRDMGGFWRIFGHSGANFCFDCPSEDDRNSVGGSMVANRIYTETTKYGYLGSNDLSTYLRVAYQDEIGNEQSIDNTLTGLRYSWTQANLPHNIYLWADSSQTSGDVAPRGGVKIYKFTAWYLENGVRHTKIYEGVPWMDSNNVPCIKDLVSGQFQYNCSTDPQPFLYGEL